MRHTRGRTVDITTLDELDHRLRAGARTLSGWRVRSVDLSERGAELGRCRLAGATFLGCRFAEGDAERAEAAGAVVLPRIPDVPVDVYRHELYDARELFDALRWSDSLDGRAYAWSKPGAIDGAEVSAEVPLARTLHDHAIDLALDRWRQDRRVVGVMGGHAASRGTPLFADAAALGHRLGSAGLTVATGGGPGAMEAANLGARLSSRDDAVLAEALRMLAAVPSYRPSVDAWVLSAFDALAALDPSDADGGPVANLGIPTWHYGHEPPNIFATAIAKYFRNATREAILLEVCDAGIVFLPGAGGTVQEIFQDACENYYADESSVAPMVLVGREHWSVELPAWPLLQALAAGRAMEPHVHLVDTVEEALEVVTTSR
ncbi:Rossmann fold nucleotide-binding protein [Nocardioides sp. 31GB23]|uniref:LOG family protein n=1 Tax=Nocardioides sp. 31GB23 TaxID=3156065 RepID=UPI0032AEC8BC